IVFFFSSRRRHTRSKRDWSSDVCSSDLVASALFAQVTAAALTSENKALATPHSVDSISTSGNQEDYVSMGMSGARRLEGMLKNRSEERRVGKECRDRWVT